MAVIALEKGVQALLLAMLIRHLSPQLRQTARAALLVAALVSAPFCLSLFANYPVALSTALALERGWPWAFAYLAMAAIFFCARWLTHPETEQDPEKG